MESVWNSTSKITWSSFDEITRQSLENSPCSLIKVIACDVGSCCVTWQIMKDDDSDGTVKPCATLHLVHDDGY